MNSRAQSLLLAKVARALERAGLERRPAAAAGASGPAAILLALSGGPDSVALLHALRTLAARGGYCLTAAHLNHGLRGAESDRDEAFVRELCATLGVELIVERACDLDRSAPNLEERAREARYAFLAAAAAGIGASYVATAHHADDQAETVMLRLLRGAGAAGLRAMDERGRPGAAGVTVLRPLLRVRRREVTAYLEAIGTRCVADSSNADRGFLRNRIRLDLLPALERDYAPGLGRRLASLAAELGELDDYVGRAARAELELRLESANGHAALNLDGFSSLHPALAAALLRHFLAHALGDLRGVSRRLIEALERLCRGGSPSARLNLPAGWRAERRYDALVLARHRGTGEKRSDYPGSAFAVALAQEGTTRVAPAGFVFDSHVMPADAIRLPADRWRACFDADAAEAGLMVRGFVRGDRVFPIGMEGSRKLHDVYIDRKLPRPRRATFPVVTLGERIAWVPGMVRGRVALVSDRTARVLCLNALEDASNP